MLRQRRQRGEGVGHVIGLLHLAQAELAPLFAIGLGQVILPVAHPCQVGADPGPWLAQADVVLVNKWDMAEVFEFDLDREPPHELRIGLYDPLTGARVPAWRDDGSRWPDDAVRVVILGGEIMVPVNGFYQAKDGRWMCFNGAYPHLRDGILKYFDAPHDQDALIKRIAQHDSAKNEADFEKLGLCMAPMFSHEEWLAHPQGKAMSDEPTPIPQIFRLAAN